MITTNHKKISKRLKERGWEKKHISTTIAIMKKVKHNHHGNLFFVITLIFILIGNCFLLIGLLPIILELPPWFILTILAMVGFIFGFLVDKLVNEHEFTKVQYLLAFLIVPAASVILIHFIDFFVNKFAGDIGFKIDTQTFSMSLSYIISFVLPHLIKKSVR